jgi:hypothetical protein
MAVKEIIDVRDSILKHLEDDHRNLKYLSIVTDIPYGTLYSCFIQRTFGLTDENLEKINTALDKNFKK